MSLRFDSLKYLEIHGMVTQRFCPYSFHLSANNLGERIPHLDDVLCIVLLKKIVPRKKQSFLNNLGHPVQK